MTPATEATVFVVDDDAAVRDSLQMLLRLRGQRTAGFESGEAFLSAYQPVWPGCLLLDLRMPGLSGLQVQEALVQRDYALPIIIMTAHGDIASARSALKAGAFDFLEKPLDDEVLLDVIEQALRVDGEQRNSAARKLASRSRMQRLTTRERQVMELLASGKHNRDIGTALGISPRTVEIYKARMMEKLQARSLADVIRFYLDQPGER
jgi:FixJ family two-component response regulator